MSIELSSKLKPDSISNAIVCFGGIMFLSAVTKYWLEKENKNDKSLAFITTVGGWSVTSALLFSLFSKERDLSKAGRDGLEFGLAASLTGSLLSETDTIVQYSFWALSKTNDIIGASVGNTASDIIKHIFG